jgi:hypothetical protein
MSIARKILMGLAWLYVLGVVVQFFLAGLGLPQLGGESMEAHEALGYSALHLTPILFLVLVFIAKAPVNLKIITVIFAVVAFVQPIWVTAFEGEFLAAFHVLGALAIFVLAHTIARQATRLVREEQPARVE